MSNQISENQQNSSLALMWHAFNHQVSLGVENPPEPTVRTTVAPLSSNAGTAIRISKYEADVHLSIYIDQFMDAQTGLDYLNAGSDFLLAN